MDQFISRFVLRSCQNSRATVTGDVAFREKGDKRLDILSKKTPLALIYNLTFYKSKMYNLNSEPNSEENSIVENFKSVEDYLD